MTASYACATLRRTFDSAREGDAKMHKIDGMPFIELAIDDYARLIQQHAEREATIALRGLFSEERDAYDEGQRVAKVQQIEQQRARLLKMVSNMVEGRELFEDMPSESVPVA